MDIIKDKVKEKNFLQKTTIKESVINQRMVFFNNIAASWQFAYYYGLMCRKSQMRYFKNFAFCNGYVITFGSVTDNLL